MTGLKPKAILCLKTVAIIVIGVWVFMPVLHGGWLWDDDTNITLNLLLRSPAGLWKIWFAPAGLLEYFPVTFTVEWLAWQGWGGDPFGYHCLNVAVHLLSSILLWHLLGKLGVPEAWWGGLLFAVHPVAVESVAWVSELKNTLSLPPVLLGMCAYLDYDETGRRADYLRSWLWFLAAMLCKSAVAMFPAALLLYAWWKRGRIQPSDLRAAAPFFAISLALGLVTMSFQHKWTMLGFDDAPSRGLTARAAAAGISTAFYLCKFICPLSLLPTYSRWTPEAASAAQFMPWLFFGVVVWSLWTRRATWGRHALLGVGSFWLNLSPALGLVPMAYQRISWVADHFAYIALTALAGLTAAAFGSLPAFSRIGRPVVWSAFMAIFAALAWQSHRYAAIFVNRQTLWTYTLLRNPASWAAHNDLGYLLMESGQPAKATAEFLRALELEPDSVGAHNNLAVVLARSGRLPQAIVQYERCLKLGADYFEILYNLAMALCQTGRTAEAIYHYERALQLNSDFADAQVNLGAALANLGRLKEAIAHFEKGVQLNPNDVRAHANLGIAFARTGRLAEAVSQYKQVLRLKPDYPDLHFNLGNALLDSGRIPEAIAEYEAALRANPGDAEARGNLTLALRAMDKEK